MHKTVFVYIVDKAQKKEKQLYQYNKGSSSAILFHYSILQISMTFSPVGSTSLLLDNRHSQTICFVEVQKSPWIVKNVITFFLSGKRYSYTGSLQLLGLEGDTATAHREHVVRGRAYLSCLFLCPLRSLWANALKIKSAENRLNFFKRVIQLKMHLFTCSSKRAWGLLSISGPWREARPSALLAIP